jgi:hypothetical protein
MEGRDRGLIEFGRLRLPPARRDVFGGDGDRLEAGFREGERRGGRAQGLEADLLEGVGEEPALELDAVFGGVLAGLEFVQGGFGAADEGFVVEDRGVEGCDEFESGSSAARARSWSTSVCLASSSWLSAKRGSRVMNISRRRGPGARLPARLPSRAVPCHMLEIQSGAPGIY